MKPSRTFALNVRALYCRVWPALLDFVQPVDAPASDQDLRDLEELEEFMVSALHDLRPPESGSDDLDSQLLFAGAALYVKYAALTQDPTLSSEPSMQHALEWVKWFDCESGGPLTDHASPSDVAWLHWGSQALADLRQELEEVRSGRPW